MRVYADAVRGAAEGRQDAGDRGRSRLRAGHRRDAERGLSRHPDRRPRKPCRSRVRAARGALLGWSIRSTAPRSSSPATASSPSDRPYRARRGRCSASCTARRSGVTYAAHGPGHCDRAGATAGRRADRGPRAVAGGLVVIHSRSTKTAAGSPSIFEGPSGAASAKMRQRAQIRRPGGRRSRFLPALRHDDGMGHRRRPGDPRSRRRHVFELSTASRSLRQARPQERRLPRLGPPDLTPRPDQNPHPARCTRSFSHSLLRERGGLVWEPSG